MKKNRSQKELTRQLVKGGRGLRKMYISSLRPKQKKRLGKRKRVRAKQNHTEYYKERIAWKRVWGVRLGKEKIEMVIQCAYVY